MEEEDIGLLRSKGIPCASVMRIAPGTDDVELRLRVFFREHNHLHGHAIVISYPLPVAPLISRFADSAVLLKRRPKTLPQLPRGSVYIIYESIQRLEA